MLQFKTGCEIASLSFLYALKSIEKMIPEILPQIKFPEINSGRAGVG
ncbi:MAG: hypothetical protein AB8G22_18770 [Saprospiraceae bacterium]